MMQPSCPHWKPGHACACTSASGRAGQPTGVTARQEARLVPPPVACRLAAGTHVHQAFRRAARHAIQARQQQGSAALGSNLHAPCRLTVNDGLVDCHSRRWFPVPEVALCQLAADVRGVGLCTPMQRLQEGDGLQRAEGTGHANFVRRRIEVEHMHLAGLSARNALSQASCLAA